MFRYDHNHQIAGWPKTSGGSGANIIMMSYMILLDPGLLDAVKAQYQSSARCEWCALGLPLEGTLHVIPGGLHVPCVVWGWDRPAPEPVRFTGRGIQRRWRPRVTTAAETHPPVRLGNHGYMRRAGKRRGRLTPWRRIGAFLRRMWQRLMFD